MKEYRLHKGWKIFIFIFAPLLIALFIWLPFMLQEETERMNQPPQNIWILSIFCIVMALLMALGLWDAIKGRFVITERSVFSEHPFVRKELFFNEIKGYRVDARFIYILPNSKEKKKIKVSKYYSSHQEVIHWLNRRYSDTDIVATQEEHNEILHNDEYGLSQADRSANLAKAKKMATILNVTGAVLGGWIFFWPEPYKLAVAFNIVFPVVVALMIRKFNGLLRMEVKDKSAYAQLNFALLGPSFGLALAALYDFNILNYDKIWMPAIVLTVVLAALVFWGRALKINKENAGLFLTLMMLLFYFGYGYGAVAAINCGFDSAAPETKQSTIVKKRSSSGKSYTYYIYVQAGSDTETPLELQVPRHFYTSLQIGDDVLLDYRKGLLDAPWVNVRTLNGVSAIASH